MKTDILAASLKETPADVVIVPVYRNESVADGPLAPLNAALGGTLAELIESGDLHGRRDEVTYLHAPAGLTAKRLVLVGMGEPTSSPLHQIRRAFMTGVRFMRGKRHGAIAVADRGEGSAFRFGEMAAEAVSVAAVDLSQYRTEDRNDLAVESVIIQTSADREADVRRGAERGRIVADGMNLTRSLGNEPGDHLTPAMLAERTAEMAAANGMKCEILDESKLKEMGMGLLLGVARGSEEPARLVVVSYEPEGEAEGETWGFVGKGITFDSGGISIKPREGMEWMKYDMCGAGAVVGAMSAIAKLRPNRKVLGIVASAENMPSGKAIKPGDVLRSYSGKTVEVLNTDAEGRLVLSDALTYAQELGATRLVDLATLTGACVIALGHVYAGLMSNDQAWADSILDAGKRVDEKLWQLPMDKAYREQVRSDIADIKNLGGRAAGTITAGYFLREFVGSTPWAHLDIAGTAWIEDDRPNIARGASGFGVPTLVELAAPVSE